MDRQSYRKARGAAETCSDSLERDIITETEIGTGPGDRDFNNISVGATATKMATAYTALFSPRPKITVTDINK